MINFGPTAIGAARYGETQLATIRFGSVIVWTAGELPAAAVLTSPTASATGTTTATGTVVTDTASGTLYAYASTSITPPAKAALRAAAQATQTISSAGTKTLTPTGLLPETIYYTHYLHRVGGVDSDIVSSASFTTDAEEEVPTGTASLLIQFEDTTEGALPHRIYSDPVGDETQPIELAAGDSEHELTGLDWNTEHEITIKVWADPDEVSPLTATLWTSPELPPGLSAAASGENSITLTLTPPASPPASGETGSGYAIEQSPNGTTGWTQIELVVVGDAPSEVTGLTGETDYYFRARSVNANPYPHDPGYSGYSGVVSAETDVDSTAPTNSAVSATAGDTTAALAATSSESGTRYWFVSTSGTAPSASSLKAGTGAAYASNEACTAATPCTQTATGLTNGVTYYLHTLANDGTNDSTIATTASFTPAAATPYADLIAYWPMDEASGTRADAVGSLDLTQPSGAVSQTTGITGKAFTSAAHFVDGETDYLTKDTGCNVLHNLSAFSVAMWLYPVAQRDVWNCGTGSVHCAISGGNMYFTVAGTAGEWPIGTLSQWQFWVMGYDNVANKIFLSKNGAAKSELTHSGSNNTSLVDLRLGVYTNWFDGDMGPFAWFGTYLSDARIAELYNSGTGVLYTP